MANIILNINKIFDHRIRLGIMSILMVNEYADFNTLKELLGATDGNLASHLKNLEGKNYVEVKKEFVGRKPQTTYAVTDTGKQAFSEHLNALEKILRGGKD